jgi:Fe-S-cluster containining protein
MTLLNQLHRDIDIRVHTIRQHQPDWLCSKGCDTCCRRLAEIPQLTEAEWRLLQEGLNALAPEHLDEIREKTKALANQTSRPIICPMLDPRTGACPVYAQRPVACRTYGFYAQRDQGLYCQDIKSLVDTGVLADVVWGNHDNIDRQLKQSGESLNLTEWFVRWDAEKNQISK